MEAKKDLIIQAAYIEFNTNGYLAGSTNTIAKNAAVAKGLLFHYFGNKEQLYIYLLEQAYGIIENKLEKEFLAISTYMDPFELVLCQ